MITLQTWKTGALGHVISIVEESVLESLQHIWSFWKSGPIPSLSDCTQLRLRWLQEYSNITVAELATSEAAAYCALHTPNELSKQEHQLMYEEVKQFVSNGSISARTVLGLTTEPPHRTNPTLYELPADDSAVQHTLHYGQLPFKCYHNRFLFTTERLKGSVSQQQLNELAVADKHFDSAPLLSNSVQQVTTPHLAIVSF